MNLTESEIQIIKDFEEKIKSSTIWNENKIYINYFIKAFLDNNFLAAANTWFTFIEKYLRMKLIFVEHSIHWGNFLDSLNSIEKSLEEWEWQNKTSTTFDILKKNILQYGFKEEITIDTLLTDLDNFTKQVGKTWPHPKNWYYFNDICKKLYEHWKIDKALKDELITMYSKYRNPLHHWLFNKLITSINWDTITMPIYCGWIENSWIQQVSMSNVIIRETTDYLTPISRRVSVELLELINKVIYKLWDFTS